MENVEPIDHQRLHEYGIGQELLAIEKDLTSAISPVVTIGVAAHQKMLACFDDIAQAGLDGESLQGWRAFCQLVAEAQSKTEVDGEFLKAACALDTVLLEQKHVAKKVNRSSHETLKTELMDLCEHEAVRLAFPIRWLAEQQILSRRIRRSYWYKSYPLNGPRSATDAIGLVQSVLEVKKTVSKLLDVLDFVRGHAVGEGGGGCLRVSVDLMTYNSEYRTDTLLRSQRKMFVVLDEVVQSAAKSFNEVLVVDDKLTALLVSTEAYRRKFCEDYYHQVEERRSERKA